MDLAKSIPPARKVLFRYVYAKLLVESCKPADVTSIVYRPNAAEIRTSDTLILVEDDNLPEGFDPFMIEEGKVDTFFENHKLISELITERSEWADVMSDFIDEDGQIEGTIVPVPRYRSILIPDRVMIKGPEAVNRFLEGRLDGSDERLIQEYIQRGGKFVTARYIKLDYYCSKVLANLYYANTLTQETIILLHEVEP